MQFNNQNYAQLAFVQSVPYPWHMGVDAIFKNHTVLGQSMHPAAPLSPGESVFGAFLAILINKRKVDREAFSETRWKALISPNGINSIKSAVIAHNENRTIFRPPRVHAR